MAHRWVYRFQAYSAWFIGGLIDVRFIAHGLQDVYRFEVYILHGSQKVYRLYTGL